MHVEQLAPHILRSSTVVSLRRALGAGYLSQGLMEFRPSKDDGLRWAK